MNRNDFLKMLDNSGPSDRQMIVEVNELITVFPYFQSAYMLLLKGLQNTADVKFENQLRSCAMHIADREVLYYFLRKEPVPEVKAETRITENVPEPEQRNDSQQTVIESAKNSQYLIEEIERDSGETTIGAITGDHTVMISAEEGDDGYNATVLLLDEESGELEEKVIYMDPGFSISEESDLLELVTDENNGTDLLNDHSESLKQPVADTSSIKQKQSDLIDKFIIANPRIEPIKEKSGKPVEDITKPFIEERGSFVTETLARIYVNQGYYSRAIEIYEKLSLKFPEKSSYFASQIEKVKEFIKK